jgi:V8-like Glu-specific endopeptidase
MFKNKKFLYIAFSTTFSFLSILSSSFAMDLTMIEETEDRKRKATAKLNENPQKKHKTDLQSSVAEIDQDSEEYMVHGTKKKEEYFEIKISETQIKSEENIDENRELLYKGIPLSQFPKIEKDKFYKSFCKDRILGQFESSPEDLYDPDQRLLLGSDIINSYLKSATLMGTNNGMLSNEIDRRKKVKITNSSPWSGIASLEMIYYTTDDQNTYVATYYGSGALICHRYILTAAHNLYDKNTGYLPLSVKASPGLKDGAQYCNPPISTKYYIAPEYFKDPTAKNDIAIIDFGNEFQGHNPLFQDNVPFSFGIKFVPEERLIGKMLTITGFPGGAIINNRLCYLKCKTMMSSDGRAVKVNDGIILYDIDTTRGNSGSPVYFKEKEEFFCCGVHSGEGTDSTNIGSYLDKDKIALIKQWLSR